MTLRLRARAIEQYHPPATYEDREALMVRLALMATFVVASACADAAELSGLARVHDGDMLTIGDTRIRLEGIDAPPISFASAPWASAGRAALRLAITSASTSATGWSPALPPGAIGTSGH
jgi:endonuclease YncB( thermonuclease family)